MEVKWQSSVSQLIVISQSGSSHTRFATFIINYYYYYNSNNSNNNSKNGSNNNNSSSIVIGAAGGGQAIQGGGGCGSGSGGVGVASDVSDGWRRVGSDVSDVGGQRMWCRGGGGRSGVEVGSDVSDAGAAKVALERWRT